MDALFIPLNESERCCPKAVVCVTGVTGYVAGPIVERLLAAGFTVHGTCRDPNDAKKLAALEALPGGERLKLFKADLLDAASFDASMAGATYVLHTASPYITAAVSVADGMKKLIEPAIKGTEAVLAAVERSATVKRVILTSSAAAVYGDPYERGAGHLFNNTEWNTSSRTDHQPYSYSKMAAEKRAWELQGRQATPGRWSLVTINPAFVCGPPLGSRADSESVVIVSRLMNGDFWPFAPPFGFGWVDVRDVAAMHVRAMCTPGAQGRYLASSESLTFQQIAAILAPVYPKHYLPSSTTKMSRFFISLIGPCVGISWEVIKTYYEKVPQFDASPATRDLEITFTPIKRAILDMVKALIDSKIVKA